MRGVPSVDESGINELVEIAQGCHRKGIKVILCGLNRNVLARIDRYDQMDAFDFIVWDALTAISILDQEEGNS